MENLSALLLELGRTIMILHMEQSLAEAVVNEYNQFEQCHNDISKINGASCGGDVRSHKIL